jgi:hypothetical protein
MSTGARVFRFHSMNDSDEPGGFDETSYTCTKTDGKWEFDILREAEDYEDDLDDYTEDFVPARKVVLVFAVESGEELFSADKDSEDFDVQLFDTRNWENAAEQYNECGGDYEPYFSHDKYGENAYLSDDARFVALVGGCAANAREDEDAPFAGKVVNLPWQHWMRVHGSLLVLYRHPLSVACYDISWDMGNDRDVFECHNSHNSDNSDSDNSDSDSDDDMWQDPCDCGGCTRKQDFYRDCEHVQRSKADRMVAAVLLVPAQP